MMLVIRSHKHDMVAKQALKKSSVYFERLDLMRDSLTAHNLQLLHNLFLHGTTISF
jgi:hypothetical protein